jgi:preprotein translocase subunit YajC
MHRKQFYLLGIFLLMATAGLAQTPDGASAGQEQGPPAGGGGRAGRGGQGDGGIRGMVTAINGSTMQLTKVDGSTVTVKLSDKTEYRKDRQPAKIGDFKVGDLVMVRGEENADHTVSAQMVGGRTGNGAAGGAGRAGGPGGAGFGEMGKDFVAGEVKSVDAPKLTVKRSDNVTQTLELNEETSLRRGRDSITMADIQAGDHVIIHGALQNNVFVPKNVMVLSTEQWERLQQMAAGRGGAGGNAPANVPADKPPQP